LGNGHSFYSKGSFGLNNIVIEVFLTEHALESMRVAFNPFLTRGKSQGRSLDTRKSNDLKEETDCG
jgi:hypothetical protein